MFCRIPAFAQCGGPLGTPLGAGPGYPVFDAAVANNTALIGESVTSGSDAPATPNTQAFSLINSTNFSSTFPGWLDYGNASTPFAADKVRLILNNYKTAFDDAQVQVHNLASDRQLDSGGQETVITAIRANTAVHVTEAQLLADLVAVTVTHDASELNWQAQEHAHNVKFENVTE